MQNRILLIEDDPRLAALVCEYLGESGYLVTTAASGTTGMDLATSTAFDALILDLMLPDMDGLEVCRKLRAQSGIPIVMLTARGDATDRVVGLEMGADDYLPKPFEPRELLARLRAILRRWGTEGSRRSDLLLILAENAGRVLSRERLLESATGETLEAFDRSIDVHISRIRSAIEDDPKTPRRIITVRGAGYVFARQQD